MKKKYIILIISFFAVTAGITGVYLLARPTVLGNMSSRYSEQVTTASDISFTGEAGSRIKFVFKSDVLSGNLDVTLYDAAGKAVYTLDNAKELAAYYTLERSGTYTLAASCDQFVGPDLHRHHQDQKDSGDGGDEESPCLRGAQCHRDGTMQHAEGKAVGGEGVVLTSGGKR